MAATTKTKKIQSHYPPREIRDETKARRAWLAAKAAEISAQPGREARIVGKGSYQEVAEYEVVQVQGREQMRGTCQCCGSDVAVDKAADDEFQRTAHHGYKRPGWGYQTASCMGARALPYELGHDKLDRLVALLEREVEQRVARVAALQAGKVQKIMVAGPYRRNGREMVEVTPQNADLLMAERTINVLAMPGAAWVAVVRDEVARVERELVYVRRDLRDQQARRAAWAHRPEALRTVVVA
jgi:hypothetical protein